MTYSTEIGEERTEFPYGSGCKACANTGYRGRTGIFEILTVGDEIRSMLLKDASASELHAQAVKEGMMTLMQDGMLKAKEDITTPTEVLRNAYSVD